MCVAMQSRYLEILDFTQFFDHFVFTPNEENVLEKDIKIYWRNIVFFIAERLLFVFYLQL